MRGKCLNVEFFSGPYFFILGWNTGIFSINYVIVYIFIYFCIQFKEGKIWTRIISVFELFLIQRQTILSSLSSVCKRKYADQIKILFSYEFSQTSFTCSNSTMETIEQFKQVVQSYIKDNSISHIVLDVILVSLLLTMTRMFHIVLLFHC